MLVVALLLSIFLFTAPSVKRYERSELNYLAGVGSCCLFFDVLISAASSKLLSQFECKKKRTNASKDAGKRIASCWQNI